MAEEVKRPHWEIREMERRLDEMKREMVSLRKDVDRRFSRVDQSFSRVDQRFSRVDRRFWDLYSEMNTQWRWIGTIVIVMVIVAGLIVAAVKFLL